MSLVDIFEKIILEELSGTQVILDLIRDLVTEQANLTEELVQARLRCDDITAQFVAGKLDVIARVLGDNRKWMRIIKEYS